jgi:F-type H+-transporting ATPase subunit delta
MFDIADIEGIIEGLQLFSKVVDSSRELRLLFTSNIFSDEEKSLALKTLLSYLGVSEQTEKFLKLIIMQNHVNAIKEIIKASTIVYNERLKKVRALVISPVTLEKNHIENLKSTLSTLTNRSVEIDSQIDPSLLGGFIVKVGSTVYDSSLKGQFRLLRAELVK